MSTILSSRKPPSLLIIFISTFAFSACGGGGRLEVKTPPATVALASTQPSTSTISAEVAILSLKNSHSAQAQGQYIEDVLKMQGSAFEWSVFWEKLAILPAETIYPENRNSIYSLHSLSCRDDHFRSFVGFAQQSPVGYPWFAGSQCQCPNNLGLSEASHALKTMIGHFHNAVLTPDGSAETTAVSIAHLFSKEATHNANPHRLNEALTETQWLQVLQFLAGAENRSEAFIELINAHARMETSTRIAHAFLDTLTDENSNLFARSASALGLRQTLSILENVNRLQLNRLTATKVQKILNQLEIQFLPNTFAETTPERLQKGLEYLQRIRRIQSQFAASTFSEATLMWLQKLHRKLETELLSMPAASARALLAENRGTLDVLWLEYTLFKRNHFPFNEIDQGLLAHRFENPLDQILQARLKAHLAQSPWQIRSALEFYCGLLREKGIQGSTQSIEAFRAKISGGLTPGCHRFETSRTSQEQSINLSITKTESIDMPDDSVVVAPSANITMQAPSMVGSFFDLSAHNHFSPLPEESTPDDFDAITFAVPLGFRVTRGATFLPGVHWVVVHLPFKDAQQGPAATAIPQNGANGGNLSLILNEDNPNLEPTFVSFAGEGQQGAPALRGGHIDQSIIDLGNEAVSHWLYLERQAHAVNSQTPDLPYYTLLQPTRQRLQELLHDASWDAQTIEPEITDSYMAHLLGNYPEQIRKILNRACTGQVRRSDCFRNIIKVKAMQTLLSEVSKDNERSPLLYHRESISRYPDSDIANTFAAHGPLNPNGQPGRAGSLQINGDNL